MEIDNWKLLAAIPPLIVWAGLFFYLKKMKQQVTKINKLIQEIDSNQKRTDLT